VQKAYQIEILNNSGSLVTPVSILAPINKAGDTISLTYRLSNYGQLNFRVSTKDPLFDTVGDVFEPYRYHVRVLRFGSEVWRGVIINNPQRNNRYVECVAYSYLFLLKKILIRHDASVTPGDGFDNYKTFNSGTMDTAITTIINNAIADAGSNNPVSTFTIGTIENPNYPSNYTDTSGNPMTGAWTFSSSLTLQYDYRSALYVIGSMAQYVGYDFEVTHAKVFNFKDFIGNRVANKTFTYGPGGNLLDYNLPRYGERMANNLIGVAADFGNQILHVEQSDTASMSTYGKVQDVAAYIDVKNTNALKSRLNEELRLISTPESEVHLELNDKAPQLGEYNIGDIITIDINDGVVSYRNQQRRIVGINIKVTNSGSDQITLITNKPKDGI